MTTVNPAWIARLERCHGIAAECAAHNSALIHVFERMEAELSDARAAMDNDPIARARRITEQRRSHRA